MIYLRCFDHGQYRQALGIAIETKRMDIFERAVTGKLSDEQVNKGKFSLYKTQEQAKCLSRSYLTCPLTKGIHEPHKRVDNV